MSKTPGQWGKLEKGLHLKLNNEQFLYVRAKGIADTSTKAEVIRNLIMQHLKEDPDVVYWKDKLRRKSKKSKEI